MKRNQSNIKKAKKYLDNNNCIGIPTETVYGLAGNAYSDKAVQKIFRLKKRPKNNPLIVHYYNLSNLKKDCFLNKKFFSLYKKFCPGPLTFVLKLKKNSKISKFVTNNKSTLAIRFPSHTLLKNLLKKLNYPIAAPSANIYNNLSPVKAKDVSEEFKNNLDFVLDGGTCKIGIESTIISLVSSPKILRLGGIEVKKLRKILKLPLKLTINTKKKISPGQSEVHYSPGIPLRINIKKPKKNEAYVVLKKSKHPKKNYFHLSKNGNLNEAAKNLYSTLRKIKNNNYKFIAVEKINNFGLGISINDRLKRASKKFRY